MFREPDTGEIYAQVYMHTLPPDTNFRRKGTWYIMGEDCEHYFEVKSDPRKPLIVKGKRWLSEPQIGCLVLKEDALKIWPDFAALRWVDFPVPPEPLEEGGYTVLGTGAF